MTPVTQEDTQLLLRLLEAASLEYTHASLVDCHGQKGENLIRSGFLVAAGFDGTANSDDDEVVPTTVRFNIPSRQLGYFSPVEGFVAIEQASLQKYRPDLNVIFGHWFGDNLCPLSHGVFERESGLIWEVGSARLLSVGMVDIWYSRRLWDPAVFKILQSAFGSRPSQKLRVILTSTGRATMPVETVDRGMIIPISDLIDPRKPDKMDFDALRLRFNGMPVDAIDEPIHLSPDGTRLTIRGEIVITFRKNSIQSRLVGILVRVHRAGKAARAADVLEQAGSCADTLDQAFGIQWPKLRPFLVSRDGLWRFEI